MLPNPSRSNGIAALAPLLVSLFFFSEAKSQETPRGAAFAVSKDSLALRLQTTSVKSSEVFPLEATSQALGTRIDTVIIRTNGYTNPFVIRQELTVERGDTLSLQKLEQSQLRVFSLQLFNTVAVSAKYFFADDTAATSNDSTIASIEQIGTRIAAERGRATVVLISVTERWYIFPIPFGSLKGVSLSQWLRKPTLENVSLGLRLQHRNFTGNNNRASVAFGIGYDPFVQLAYSTPYILGSNLTGLDVSATLQRVRNLSVDPETASILNYQQPTLSLSLGLTERLSLVDFISGAIGYTRIEVPKSAVEQTALAAAAMDGMDVYFSLGAAYTYSNVDFGQYPTEGFYLNVSATQSGFGGSAEAVGISRGAVDVRGYFKVLPEVFLAMRNYTLLTAGGKVPNYARRFIGYGLNVRGYTAEVFEGDNIQFNSLEVRVPLLRPRTVKLGFIPVEQFSYLQYGFFLTAFVDA
ncbi:MAG: BamA/TamA family outer membrane protein, partial [Rhizobacter sp.]|nr:BamA/TamA family outer membrane protein [Chlorobiales bacterium]